MRAILIPAGMGAAMGAMMLYMVHGQIAAGGSALGPALWFIAAHALIISAAAALVWLIARRWPALSARLRRVHRPSLSHAGTMIGSAALSALAIHLVIHGGL